MYPTSKRIELESPSCSGFKANLKSFKIFKMAESLHRFIGKFRIMDLYYFVSIHTRRELVEIFRRAQGVAAARKGCLARDQESEAALT